MSTKPFKEGQQVVVINSDDKPVDIAKITSITHGGKRILVEGEPYIYDETGAEKGTKWKRRHIRHVTPGLRAQLRRAELWEVIDRKLGTYSGAQERIDRRATVSNDVLEKIATLLGIDV